MKASILREQTDEELRQLHDDTRNDLIESKVKQGWGDGAEQPLKIRTLRRDLARINTVVTERELKNNG